MEKRVLSARKVQIRYNNKKSSRQTGEILLHITANPMDQINREMTGYYFARSSYLSSMPPNKKEVQVCISTAVIYVQAMSKCLGLGNGAGWNDVQAISKCLGLGNGAGWNDVQAMSKCFGLGNGAGTGRRVNGAGLWYNACATFLVTSTSLFLRYFSCEVDSNARSSRSEVSDLASKYSATLVTVGFHTKAFTANYPVAHQIHTSCGTVKVRANNNTATERSESVTFKKLLKFQRKHQKVTGMNFMFTGATKFRQNLTSWNSSKVTICDSFGSSSALCDPLVPQLGSCNFKAGTADTSFDPTHKARAFNMLGNVSTVKKLAGTAGATVTAHRVTVLTPCSLIVVQSFY
eukprot:g534.t1